VLGKSVVASGFLVSEAVANATRERTIGGVELLKWGNGYGGGGGRLNGSSRALKEKKSNTCLPNQKNG